MKYPPENPSLQLPAGAESGPGAGYAGAERRVASPGGSPRTVIRGESCLPPSSTIADDLQPLAGVVPFAAHTDWLNCTFPVKDEPNFMGTFAHQVFALVGESFAPLEELGKGLHGWKHSFKFGRTCALLGIGGQSGTVFLSLSGEACTVIPLEAWPALVTLLETHYRAKVTRWDGAVDDLKGVHSVDWAVAQYLENNFNSGGNRPSCNQHGNWIEPDGRGRTFEIGKRKNGKMMRVYEKGKQLGDPLNL